MSGQNFSEEHSHLIPASTGQGPSDFFLNMESNSASQDHLVQQYPGYGFPPTGVEWAHFDPFQDYQNFPSGAPHELPATGQRHPEFVDGSRPQSTLFSDLPLSRHCVQPFSNSQIADVLPSLAIPAVKVQVRPKGWARNELKRPKLHKCVTCNTSYTSACHLKRHYGTMLHERSKLLGHKIDEEKKREGKERRGEKNYERLPGTSYSWTDGGSSGSAGQPLSQANSPPSLAISPPSGFGVIGAKWSGSHDWSMPPGHSIETGQAYEHHHQSSYVNWPPGEAQPTQSQTHSTTLQDPAFGNEFGFSDPSGQTLPSSYQYPLDNHFQGDLMLFTNDINNGIL